MKKFKDFLEENVVGFQGAGLSSEHDPHNIDDEIVNRRSMQYQDTQPFLNS